jgi:phosphoglucosamine mutase
MVSGCAPNGKNINTDCGSTHPTTLAKFVVEHQCHVGVAFDGDGDRALFVDAQGGIIDGDAVLFICAKRLKEIGQLPGNAIVATVMSNVGLELGLQGLGIDLVRCQVGDRYVMEEMTKHGIALGGEQSGHIIFSEYLQTGDGLITAMMVLRAMAESGRALADLAADLDVYPQVLVNVPVRRKTDLQSVPEIAAVIRDVELRLAGQGRLLVRYSGTEPLLRIMVEGRNQVEIQGYSDEIASAVKRCLL